jgi:hypothetical protein
VNVAKRRLGKSEGCHLVTDSRISIGAFERDYPRFSELLFHVSGSSENNGIDISTARMISDQVTAASLESSQT